MRFLTPPLALLGVLALAACSGASSAPIHPAPAIGPKIAPKPIFAVFHPTNPFLRYIFLPTQVAPEANGNLLVADAGGFNRVGSKVVELSPTGQVLWVLAGPGLDFVHSAYLTSRGTILITDTNNNRVIEVDRSGKIVWNSDDLGGGGGYLGRGRLSDGSQLLYPNDAKELPNGHLLISSRMNSTVFEIDRNGKVYWKCHSFLNQQGRPDALLRQHNPDRLTNGDTLIADSDNARVVEVDRSCSHIVWQYDGTSASGQPNIVWPRDANLLPNGDVLIDDSLHNRLIEVNRDKQIVQSWDNLPMPYSADLLPNGNLAVGDAGVHGVAIFTMMGQLAGVIATRPPFTLPSSLANGGFETGGDPGWQKDDLLTESLPPGVRADMYFDTSVKHSGNSSGRITWTSGPHAPIWWGQAVRVTPGHRYQFTGWIKTENVTACNGCDLGRGTASGDSAYYSITFIKPGPFAAPSPPPLPQHSGTIGWTRDSTTFTVPDGVVAISIQATLAGKGTVWFDDVSLKDLGP
jgi:hypothetical protein